MNPPFAVRIGLLNRFAAVACSLVAVLMAMVGCTPTQVTTEVTVSMETLKRDLVRGVSTRADVHRLLGQPSGYGTSVLPPNLSARDVWFYQEIKVKDFKSEEAGSGLHRERYVRLNMTHRILLVFFDGEVYDGYMWYTNVGPLEGKVRQEPGGN